MKAAATATSKTSNERPLPTFSLYINEAAPIVVDFDAAAIMDLVRRIGRAVANFSGPDDYAQLDVYLAQLLRDTDPELRWSLTLAVLAGAQEAARFGLMMVAATGEQLLACPLGLPWISHATSSDVSAVASEYSSVGKSAVLLDKLRALRPPKPTKSSYWTIASSWIRSLRPPTCGEQTGD